MTESTPTAHGLSIHRLEALTDGIYAVAMTLLVIDLKLPEHATLQTSAALAEALAELAPKFQAWVISFLVLAIFWSASYRTHSHMRHADGRLVTLSVVQLGLASLMPFSCALLGQHAGVLSQAVYSANMALLALAGLLVSRYVHRHPELTATPMSLAKYNGARVRIIGLIAISLLAVLIQFLVGEFGGNGIGNVAFVLMAVINPLSRRVERATESAGT